MKSPRDQCVNLGLHAACWALVMCHHELCPTLVSDPVQLSFTEAAPWLYKKMVYGYSTRKTSPGIVTLVPCHLMVTITHANQGISRFHLLVPYLGRRFHWLSLNYKVPRQLSYGAVVPELYGKKIVYNDSTRRTSGWNCYTDIPLVYAKSNNRNELCMC